MASKNQVALSIKDLKKDFVLPHEKVNSIKEKVIRFHKTSYEKLHVLKGINLEVKKGEFVGIVGRNGSGKSTLLKIIGGVYQPTSGEVSTNGTLTPFIELGIGFNPELTGRENVFLNGAILGLSRKQVINKYDEIVEFAEMEKFMDQKLKNYSSGMQVRLAFSIAMQAHNDILLIDEVLAVGDANFQRKCFDQFKRIKQEGKTVIFVTHDMGAVQEYCDRAILIDNGLIASEGSPQQVTRAYNNVNLKASERSVSSKNKATKDNVIHEGNGSVEIIDVWTEKNGKKSSAFGPEDHITVNVRFKAKDNIINPVYGFTFRSSDKQTVFATNTKSNRVETGEIIVGDVVTVRSEVKNAFKDGTYTISAAVASSDRSVTYDRTEDIHEFRISGWDMTDGLVQLDHKITILK